MPGERKSPLETVNRMTGRVRCQCGEEMKMKERRHFETQTMQAYFNCEKCGKHTKMLDFPWDEPFVNILQDVEKFKKEVNSRGNAAMQGL